MKRIAGIGAAAAALIATVVVASAGPSAAGAPPPLTVTPDPAKAPATITVTSEVPCEGGDQVEIAVRNDAGTANEIDVVAEVDGTGTWSAQVPVPQAGDYRVDAACEVFQTPNQADSAQGVPPSLMFEYATYTVLDIDAGLVATPAGGLVGAATQLTPATGGLCKGGAIALDVKQPDGTTVHPEAGDRDSQGNWSAPLTLSQVGTYTVTGTCTQDAFFPTGHRAAAQTAQTVFAYGPLDIVATALPVQETPPAPAVQAEANFTG